MNRRAKLIVVFVSSALAGMLLAGSLVGQNSTQDEPYPHLAVFTEVLSRIKSDYVEEPDLKSVTLGAMNGLLESIDPFASYLNADQFKEYQEKLGKLKGDVGLHVAKRFGYVAIVGVLPGSPAAKAGLAPGDAIEAIQHVATRDMPLAYAELLLRGPPGSKVDLTVLQARKAESETISLVRAALVKPELRAQIVAEAVGMVRPQALDSGRASEVAAAIHQLQQQGAQRLVLDLRNTATGAPEEGIALAKLFIDKGLIAYLQGQKFPRQNLEANGGAPFGQTPMVVITNRGTAGAAEIAAAALLDGKRAKVVGERTFGDAAVRQTIRMADGGALILSVAKYHSPSGKPIQDTGVLPDVQMMESEVSVSEEEEEAAPEPKPSVPAPAPSEDKLLRKAIELLTQDSAQVAGLR